MKVKMGSAQRMTITSQLDVVMTLAHKQIGVKFHAPITYTFSAVAEAYQKWLRRRKIVMEHNIEPRGV